MYYLQNIFIHQLGPDVGPDFDHQETTGDQSRFSSSVQPGNAAGWVKLNSKATHTLENRPSKTPF